MTHNSTTVLFALSAGLAIVGAAALAQSTPPAAPPGVDSATHAAHLQQNSATHANGVQPGATGDANADLANQIAALRAEVAEIRTMLTQQYAAPTLASAGGSGGMGTKQKRIGNAQVHPMQPMQPMEAIPAQPAPAAGGMSGMVGGSGQPSGAQRRAQAGHPAPHNAVGVDNADLVNQMAAMRADVAKLQAALSQGQTGQAPAASSGGMGMGMGGMNKTQKPMGGGQMQPPQRMQPMQAQPATGGAGAGGMPGMSSGGSPPAGGGGMGMMDMDSKMMGGMGSGTASGGQPAGGGMAGMPGGPGGMGMDGMMQKMNGMMKMMGMGDMPMGGAGSPAAMAMPSALPGFPGASHIYHIGATGFFLDHPEHITLTLEQQTALSQKKEQALLQQAQYQRRVEEAEQDLWVLTAADQPDAAAIDTKVQQIATLQGQQRTAFIRAAGEAAKVLTDEQRKQLTGMLPPVPRPMPMTPAPAAPAMPASGGMPDM